MKTKYLLVFLLILLPYLSHGQPSYLVGTAQASIDPDQSLISVHLAGFGNRIHGRPTLQWINKRAVPEVTAMGGSSDKLYIVSNSDLLWMNLSENNFSWEKAGKAENIRSITCLNDRFYSINNSGELLKAKVSGRIKWAKIGSVDKSVTSITASDNKLFAANGDGSLWSADLSKKNIEWQRIESVNNIVSLAANKENLYAITNDGTIYKYEFRKGNHKWLEIAYKNGVTITENIHHIAIVNDRIYGVSNENILYEGEHCSDGTLSARAMAIKNGEKTVVIVSMDLESLSDIFTGQVKKEISQKVHIPASAVFINISHTHYAPISQNSLTWSIPFQQTDSIYLYRIVRNGILTAVDNALKALAPAEIYFGRGTTDIGENRSLKDHPELYDSSVDVIKVDYADKNAESYMFLAACHPVWSATGKQFYTISANYPGVARKLVEERTGTSNSLFIQGAGADINPKDQGEYITTGKKLANDVIAVLNRPMTKIDGEISFFLDTINIPITPWTKEEILAFRAKYSDDPNKFPDDTYVKWCDLMLKHYREGTMPTSLPVYVHTINIGNWKLVGFSRETTTGYSFGVKDFWPGKLVSVAGYTNDVSSYLPTHIHFEKGGYEGLTSFFSWGTFIFPKNADEIIFNKIKFLKR